MCAVSGAAGALPAFFHTASVKWTWLFQKPATTVLPVQSMTRASDGNLHVAAAADRGDDAVGRDDDRIVERRGVRRRVDLAAHERERLRVGRSADAGSRRKQAKEKRGAEQISNHAESSTG